MVLTRSKDILYKIECEIIETGDEKVKNFIDNFCEDNFMKICNDRNLFLLYKKNIHAMLYIKNAIYLYKKNDNDSLSFLSSYGSIKDIEDDIKIYNKRNIKVIIRKYPECEDIIMTLYEQFC